MNIQLFIENFNNKFEEKKSFPWEILENIQITILQKIKNQQVKTSTLFTNSFGLICKIASILIINFGIGSFKMLS